MALKKSLEKKGSKKLKKNSQMRTATMICLKSLEKTETKTVLAKATCMIDKASPRTKKMPTKKEIWKMQIWSRKIRRGKIISSVSLNKSSMKPSQESKMLTWKKDSVKTKRDLLMKKTFSQDSLLNPIQLNASPKQENLKIYTIKVHLSKKEWLKKDKLLRLRTSSRGISDKNLQTMFQRVISTPTEKTLRLKRPKRLSQQKNSLKTRHKKQGTKKDKLKKSTKLNHTTKGHNLKMLKKFLPTTERKKQ